MAIASFWWSYIINWVYLLIFRHLSPLHATSSWQRGQEFFCSSHRSMQAWWKKCWHLGKKAAVSLWSSKQIEQGSSFCFSVSLLIVSALRRRWTSASEATPGTVGWSTMRPSGVTNIWGRPRLTGAGVFRWFIGGSALNKLVSDWVWTPPAAGATPKGLPDGWSCIVGRPCTIARMKC